ncbi:MAG: ABC transporter ATP-binding protein [Pseudomonadales bacterium]|nr:ABC transporter ATP-binding protein [Pseudomonadales bacterium]MCP5344239.1 ABC transporter ATP-binding protein [Pseudomonadales bacterium]
MSLLQLQCVSKHFGRTRVLEDISLTVEAGERHAIIGPNGAGKSTLFDLISGRLSPDSGSIHFRGQAIQARPPHELAQLGLARSFQLSSLFPRLSAFENLRCALLRPMGFGLSLTRLLPRAHALTARTEALLEEIGLAERRNTLAAELSYAEQRALELGLTLASGAELILLDEPVAGMSRSEAAQAIQLIRRVTQGRTLLLVEHDMGAVFELAERISVLADGRLIASGSPAQIRTNPLVQQAYLGSAIMQEGVDA